MGAGWECHEFKVGLPSGGGGTSFSHSHCPMQGITVERTAEAISSKTLMDSSKPEENYLISCYLMPLKWGDINSIQLKLVSIYWKFILLVLLGGRENSYSNSLSEAELIRQNMHLA